MRKHKTFEEYITRIRELSGIKTDEDVFKELQQKHFKSPELSEEEIKKIDESSLTRIRQHIIEHDIATITAFREQDINCLNKVENREKIFTKKENLERNNLLRSSLLKLDYGITEIDGINKRDKIIVKENSFLIVNLNNNSDFIDNIINLGKYFCQDSVLLKKKEEENAYLIGTNNSKDPGLNNKVQLGKFKGGLENDFMSKIRGRPFYFEQYDNLSIGAKQVITIRSKKILEEALI